MSATFTVGPLRLADAAVDIATNDAGFADVLQWCFRDLAAPDEPCAEVNHFEVLHLAEPFPRWAIWRDGEPCQLTLEEGYVLFHLQWELNRVVLERRNATLHAAAIEIDGGCVLLSGITRSGKTTLAGWMAAHGAGYIADEVVALDEQARALHYRRPLGARHGGPLDRLFTYPSHLDRRFDSYEMLVPASALGGVRMPDNDVEVAAIVFPRYEPGEPAGAIPLDRSIAFQRLCESSPGLLRHGRPVFDLLSELAHRVPVLRLTINDPADAEQHLRSALSDSGVSR